MLVYEGLGAFLLKLGPQLVQVGTRKTKGFGNISQS
jgi:hypothetical protein